MTAVVQWHDYHGEEHQPLQDEYQIFLVSAEVALPASNYVPALPRYKVLVYVGKEFGDLMSSVSSHNRVGTILYRTKCDPFLMLSDALGTTKSKPQVGHARGYVCEEVAGEKVYELSSQLIAEREQAPVVPIPLERRVP